MTVSKKKITGAEYVAFQIAFWKDHAFPHQRMGQAFCNQFMDTIGRGDHTQELFYTSSTSRAEDLIFEHFIEG